MCQLNTNKPVILPLFKKLYFTPEVDTDFNDEPAESTGNKPKTGIMNTELQEVLKDDPSISTEEVLKLLSLSDTEREYVESTTSKQRQCEEWYLHKAGFITALNLIQSAFPRESSPARRHSKKIMLKCRKVGRSYYIGQDTSHPYKKATGNGTTKCQGRSGSYFMKKVLARHISGSLLEFTNVFVIRLCCILEWL